MATPEEKAAAFQKWAGSQSKQVNGRFTALWLRGSGKFTGEMKTAIAELKKSDPKGAVIVEAFFSDPAAQKALLNKVAPIKTPGENLGDIVDAAVPGSPWASVMQTVYNMGIQAAVLIGAVVLIVLGVIILLRAPLAKVTPVGKVAKAIT